MKILIVSIWTIENKSIGGTERYIIHLASALKKRGHEVDVLMLSGEEGIINGVRCHSAPFICKKINEYILKNYINNVSSLSLDKLADLFSYFEVEDYDVIHVNSPLCFNLFPNKNKIITLHNYPLEFDIDWGSRHYPEMCNIVKSSDNKSIIFNSPSTYYADMFTKDFGVNVEVIPHCYDEQHLFTNLDKETIRNKLGISEKFTILFPSRLELEQKRPDLGLQAIALIKQYLPDFQIVFVGVDDQYCENIKYLKEIAAKEQLDCKFLKSVVMSEAYKISDLVILPSKWETFGYCAVESLFLRIKTVLTTIPSFKAIAKDNGYAFLCGHDVNDMAAAILEAYRADVSNIRIDDWAKKYSEDAWVDSYLSLYKKF
ncbi:MAG: glycosyltransferase family 4 protein [Candidatus Saccharibacteria bacterium]